MKRTKTWISMMMLALVMLASPAVFADFLPKDDDKKSQESTEENLKVYLSGDQFVLSRLELRKYSRDVVGDLVNIAARDRNKLEVRTRAIQCLALYNTDKRAVNSLAVLFEATKAQSKLYPAIVMAYMQVKGEDGSQQVQPLLKHKNATVRMAAVVALGRFGGEKGYESLVAAQGEERNAKVKARISSYVE